MTEDQKQLATALSNCNYAPGTSSKRFAMNLGWLVKTDSEKVSEKQIKYMYQLACAKRNQIGQKMFDLIPKEIWAEYKKQHGSIK